MAGMGGDRKRTSQGKENNKRQDIRKKNRKTEVYIQSYQTPDARPAVVSSIHKRVHLYRVVVKKSSTAAFKVQERKKRTTNRSRQPMMHS